MGDFPFSHVNIQSSMISEIDQLRQKILTIFPDIPKQQVLLLGKEDLQEILKQAEASGLLKLSEPTSKQQKNTKQSIRDKIISICPNIHNEINIDILQQNELRQIYQKALHSKSEAQIAVPEDKKRKPEQKKKKIFSANGVVNIALMKDILIEKLPQLRNQIQNLSDQDIQKVYNKTLNKNDEEIYVAKGITTYKTVPIKSQKSQPQPYNHVDIANAQAAKRFHNYLNHVDVKRHDQDDLMIDDSSPNPNPNGDNDFLKRRGRPKKVKEDVGFTYDDAPNYGSMESFQQNGYGNFPQTINYSFNNNKKIQPQPYPAKNLKNSYDQAPLINKTSRNPLKEQSMGDYRRNGKVEVSQKQNNKPFLKNKYKCKITFYLNESDLQDSEMLEKTDAKKENSQEQKKEDQSVVEVIMNKKEQHQNQLAKIISSLHETFKNKAWKIQ